MSDATDTLQAAMTRAMAGRPKVGGFPYLAETFRRVGVTRNVWCLPSCQSMFWTEQGPVVMQGAPLIAGMQDVPTFDCAAVIAAIRTDQAGESTFPEFLSALWKAGVILYEVDFGARKVSYCGADGETYVEEYPAVDI